MKKIKLSNKGKKFFGGLLTVGFVGVVALSNLNNNPDGQQVAYIDEFQTVYADDMNDSNEELQAYKKDLKAVQAINISNDNKGWEIAHIYEEGYMDVLVPIDRTYNFYCTLELNLNQ